MYFTIFNYSSREILSKSALSEFSNNFRPLPIYLFKFLYFWLESFFEIKIYLFFFQFHLFSRYRNLVTTSFYIIFFFVYDIIFQLWTIYTFLSFFDEYTQINSDQKGNLLIARGFSYSQSHKKEKQNNKRSAKIYYIF